MKQTVKMVKVILDEIQINKKPEEVVNFYKAKGAELKDKDCWGWHSYRPEGKTYQEWEEQRQNKTEEYYKFIEENPVYNQLKITIQLDEYCDVLFNLGSNVKMSIEERFTIEVNVNIEDVNADLIKENILLMQKQYEQLKEFSIGTEQLAYNQKCNTPVSDAFLHQVNQLMLMEDCCTDALQTELANGWRIISVSPQPNSRRPDYILGKHVEPSEVKTSALRYY